MTPALSLSHSFSVVLRSSQAVCIFSSSNVIMAFCNATQQKRFVTATSIILISNSLVLQSRSTHRSAREWAYNQRHPVITTKECYVTLLKGYKGLFLHNNEWSNTVTSVQLWTQRTQSENLGSDVAETSSDLPERVRKQSDTNKVESRKWCSEIWVTVVEFHGSTFW